MQIVTRKCKRFFFRETKFPTQIKIKDSRLETISLTALYGFALNTQDYKLKFHNDIQLRCTQTIYLIRCLDYPAENIKFT